MANLATLILMLAGTQAVSDVTKPLRLTKARLSEFS